MKPTLSVALEKLGKMSETIVDHQKAVETNNHTNSISARPFFTLTGEWRIEKKECNCDERRVGGAYNSYGWKTGNKILPNFFESFAIRFGKTKVPMKERIYT